MGLAIIGWTASLIGELAVVAAVLYGCSNASSRYYEAQRQCVQAGATWIARGDYSGDCIRLKP